MSARGKGARKLEIGKLVVIGVGLIGGSFALALKKASMRCAASSASAARERISMRLSKLGVIDEASRGCGGGGARCRSRAHRHAGGPDARSDGADRAGARARTRS